MPREAGTGNTRIWREDAAGSNPVWRVTIVTLPSGKFRVDVYQPGHRGQRGDDGSVPRDLGTATVSTLEEAEKAAKAGWKRAHQGVAEVAAEVKLRTLRDLGDFYMAKGDLRAGSVVKYKKALRWIFTKIDQATPPAKLTRADVKPLLTSQDAAPSSRQVALSLLRAAYNHAKEEGLWKGDNPTEGLSVEMPRKVDLLPYLAKEHFAAFLNACSPDLRLKAAFALATGFRSGEVWNIRHEWVHEVTRPSGEKMLLIDVPDPDPRTGWVPKAGAHTFPLSSSPAALSVYHEATEHYGRGTAGEDFLFGPLGTVDQSHAAGLVQAAVKKAGVPLQGLPNKYIRGIRFHALRDSAAICWLSDDLAIYVVSSLLGHASVKTTEDYYASARARFNYAVKGMR